MIASVEVFPIRPRSNSRKTIRVSAQTINNRRGPLWFIVNWTESSSGGTRVNMCTRQACANIARSVFAQRFQPCQSYPDRMHFERFIARELSRYFRQCARARARARVLNLRVSNVVCVAVCSEIFPRTIGTNSTPIYIIYRKFHLKPNWQMRPRIVSIVWITRGLQFTFISRKGEFVSLSFFFYRWHVKTHEERERPGRERWKILSIRNNTAWIVVIS